ncbi:class I SAM-dependent methyltransferase [candidate division TA06 bacterium]|nr:class I SAM-dependent methyltransferase [candidate division TA06 bacterium]
MSLKTNYIAHDSQYKRFKAEGLNGWNDDETWQAWKAEILALIASTDFPKSGKVLELGCGAGDVALLFAEKGYQVYGIDIAPSAIEWAREKNLKANIRAEFEIGDVTKLGRWEDRYFDIVIDGHCLHCIIGDDRAKMLEEACRVLRPGGSFYVSSMCGDPKEPEVLKNYDPESRCTIHGGVAGRYFGLPEDVIKEIEKAGFKIKRHEVRDNNELQDDLIVLAEK